MKGERGSQTEFQPGFFITQELFTEKKPELLHLCKGSFIYDHIDNLFDAA